MKPDQFEIILRTIHLILAIPTVFHIIIKLKQSSAVTKIYFIL